MVIQEAAPGLEFRRGSAQRVAATALLVSVAYYVGANVGFILRIPPSTLSVLWPPTAILTATLLLAPVPRWWIYLLAAFPAHLVADLALSWPISLVLALYGTMCSEALVAAICVRLFSDAPARFDTLRRVGVFIAGAVLVAPFVSSFPAAWAVSGLLHEPYWLVWRTRFFSNVLTELTLVPAIVTVITWRLGRGGSATFRRYIEAALLAVATVTVSVVVMAEPIHGASAIPGAPYTALALFLPFILWAAVRFGPGGTSLLLLCPLLLVMVLLTHGYRSVASLPRAEGVTAIQILMIVVAIPLVCLAAVFDERRRANETLTDRLRFEELLVHLSSTFVHLSSHEVEAAFETSLRQLGQFLGLDRVTSIVFPGTPRSSWLPIRGVVPE